MGCESDAAREKTKGRVKGKDTLFARRGGGATQTNTSPCRTKKKSSHFETEELQGTFVSRHTRPRGSESLSQFTTIKIHPN